MEQQKLGSKISSLSLDLTYLRRKNIFVRVKDGKKQRNGKLGRVFYENKKMDFCTDSAKSWCKIIQKVKKLKVLFKKHFTADVTKNGFGIHCLRGLKHVNIVRIYGDSKLNFQLIRAIKGMKLESLNYQIFSCQKSEIIDSLHRFVRLKSLAIHGTPVSEKMLHRGVDQKLKKLPQLQHLDIRWHDETPLGIVRSISELTQMISFNIKLNLLNQMPITRINDSIAQFNLTTLDLHLSLNKKASIEFSKFITKFHNLQNLSLNLNLVKEDDTFKYLGEIFNQLNNLDSLNIVFSPSPRGTFKVQSFYDGLKTLQIKNNLSIRNSFDQINSSAIQFISRNHSLVKLSILYEKFEPKHIKELMKNASKFMYLKKLNLGSNNKLSDSTLLDITESIVLLPKLMSLYLDLGKSNFTGKSIIPFLQGFKKIRTIEFVEVWLGVNKIKSQLVNILEAIDQNYNKSKKLKFGLVIQETQYLEAYEAKNEKFKTMPLPVNWDVDITTKKDESSCTAS